jgi:RNA polymerase sigma-70 factor (ECF subfamily)
LIDLETFERWVDDYSDQLTAFAVQRTGSNELAFDLVQDTFVAAFGKRDSFKDEGKALSWLYAILRNKIIDHFRSASYQREESLDKYEYQDSLFFDDNGQWKSAVAPGKWGDDGLSQVERSEFMEIFWACHEQLSEHQRMAFYFKYFEGWDAERICKELGISSSNYWVLIHRAKLKLRSCLEKSGMV